MSKTEHIKLALERKIENTKTAIQQMNDEVIELVRENQKPNILHHNYNANQSRINWLQREIEYTCAKLKTLREVMYMIDNIMELKESDANETAN